MKYLIKIVLVAAFVLNSYETNPVENIEKRVSFIYSNVVMNAKHNTLLIAVTFYDEKETHACIGKDSNP